MNVPFITGFWVVILLYYVIRFVRVLLRWKHPVVFPLTEDEWASIGVHPNKKIGKLSISHQKIAVWGNGLIIFLMIAWIVFETFIAKRHFPAVIAFIPTLWNLPKLWNLFAFQEDGIVCGYRFVPWKRVQSYQFIPIDQNHRYYGYSPALNEGYELMIHTKLTEVSCLVTTERVKEKLGLLLDEQIRIHHTRTEVE